MGLILAPGPQKGDEEWQLSKYSADAATAVSESLKRKKKAESIL